MVNRKRFDDGTNDDDDGGTDDDDGGTDDDGSGTDDDDDDDEFIDEESFEFSIVDGNNNDWFILIDFV